MKVNTIKGIVTGGFYNIKHLPTFYKGVPFVAKFNKARPFLVTVFESGQVIKKEYFKDAATAAESLNLTQQETANIKAFFSTYENGL